MATNPNPLEGIKQVARHLLEVSSGETMSHQKTLVDHFNPKDYPVEVVPEAQSGSLDHGAHHASETSEEESSSVCFDVLHFSFQFFVFIVHISSKKWQVKKILTKHNNII